jgi:hypothetical protein
MQLRRQSTRGIFTLYGHRANVISVAFSPDGKRIVTRDSAAPRVWDAQTGRELKGERFPQIIAYNNEISPDRRFIAHVVGSLVELVPLQPDEEEVSYRRAHMQRNVSRYREGYEAALAAKDAFAARFYLNLLPPPEQEIGKSRASLCSRTNDHFNLLR